MGKVSKEHFVDFIITKVRSIVKVSSFVFTIKGKCLERWGSGGGRPQASPWGDVRGDR